MQKVNLAEKFALFEDHWHPRLVGTLDDYEVKLVKVSGNFVWHKHDAEDELFLVVRGRMAIDFRDRSIGLEQGEFLIVPKGVEHRPRADRECEVMLLEKKGVVNTGNVANRELTRHTLDRI